VQCTLHSPWVNSSRRNDTSDCLRKYQPIWHWLTDQPWTAALWWLVTDVYNYSVLGRQVLKLNTDFLACHIRWQQCMRDWEVQNPEECIIGDVNLHNCRHVGVWLLGSRKEFEFTSLCLYSVNLQQRQSSSSQTHNTLLKPAKASGDFYNRLLNAEVQWTYLAVWALDAVHWRHPSQRWNEVTHNTVPWV